MNALSSFKQLLLKKAQGNENLETLIRFINNEVLAEEVIESLEKMAAHKGDKANSAITSWSGSTTSPDINMLHDALGHHISKFIANNKARPPKVEDHTINTKHGSYPSKNVKLDPVAAQHLERAMHLADLAARASKHSLGKMSFEHVPTHAWEMNRTGDLTRTNGSGQTKYVDDQQGLKRRPSESSKKFPNYGYLMLDPHQSYKHKGKLRGHAGQYPFEEMKINDKHVHIDPNVEASDKYEAHPFDSHPLFNKEGSGSAWEQSEDRRSPEDKQKFAEQLSKWHESPEFNKWLENQEALEEKDPKAYEEKGKAPSNGLEGVRRASEQERAEAPAQEKEETKPAAVTPETKAASPEASAEQKLQALLQHAKENPEIAKDWNPEVKKLLGLK